MVGAAFFTEVASGLPSPVMHSLFLSSTFSSSHSHFIGIPRKRKKQSTIITRGTLSNESKIVIEKKEFEFRPSFDDYLKAMENVKIGRDSNNPSHDSPRKQKYVKGRKDGNRNDNLPDFVKFRVEEKANGKIIAVEEILEKDVSSWKTSSKTVTDKNLKKIRAKRKSELLDTERAAFKSLEDEDNVIGKPRISRVDMEERIQKLARW